LAFFGTTVLKAVADRIPAIRNHQFLADRHETPMKSH
jgi:hypothetical protein